MLVWKLSRFGRDLEEGLVYRALLRKRGIELISHKEPIPEGPLGTLITHILMAVDQFYAAATAADVLRSQKELARQGFSAGGRPPVGCRREPVILGSRYDGSPLTRVRFVPDPDVAPRVVQAFQMAADGVRYEEIVAATGICRNKSSLATILANPIYRGIRVFNRETRVEGEHGRKRRRNAADQLIESEVEPIVPEALWERVQAVLVERRANRLPPERLKGGYVLTELVRCQCGSGMAGTCSREHRYYRCKVRCGRPTVRADLLEGAVFDLIRRTLITPAAVKEMVEILNADIELRRSRETGDREHAARQVRSLERQDANLRRALRTASAAAAERISVELDAVAVELAETKRRAEALEHEARPYRITARLVQELIDQMTGLLDHALGNAGGLGPRPLREDRRRRRRAARRSPLEGASRSGC